MLVSLLFNTKPQFVNCKQQGINTITWLDQTHEEHSARQRVSVLENRHKPI